MKTRIAAVAAAAAMLAAGPVYAQGGGPGCTAWTMRGAGCHGTMPPPEHVPAATFTTDARTNPGMRSGAGTLPPSDTPSAEAFGSSRGRSGARPDDGVSMGPGNAGMAPATPGDGVARLPVTGTAVVAIGGAGLLAIAAGTAALLARRRPGGGR